MKSSEKCVLPPPAEVKIVPSDSLGNSYSLSAEKSSSTSVSPVKKSALSSRSRAGSDSSPSNIVVTWESKRGHRRGLYLFSSSSY